MMHGVVATVLSVGSAWAEDPPAPAAGTAREVHAAAMGDADAGRCATRPDLMGVGNCSWSTTQMAQRVLHEGAPYTYVGTLTPSENQLASQIAAPFTVGPQSAIHVIANEVLELLDPGAVASARLELRGKLLTVDGVQYLVVTDFAKGNS